MLQNCVSEAFIERIPIYLNYLEFYQDKYISATTLAQALNLGHVLVRKDLAKISDGGKPKIGYQVKELTRDIKLFMGYDRVSKAIIIGMGQLGKALYHYQGFSKYNIHIINAFDLNENYSHIDSLEMFCENEDIDVAIITLPKENAQEMCDRLVKLKIKAIWNFTPVRLEVPSDVIIQNENLAQSLSILIKHTNDR